MEYFIAPSCGELNVVLLKGCLYFHNPPRGGLVLLVGSMLLLVVCHLRELEDVVDALRTGAFELPTQEHFDFSFTLQPAHHQHAFTHPKLNSRFHGRVRQLGTLLRT